MVRAPIEGNALLWPQIALTHWTIAIADFREFQRDGFGRDSVGTATGRKTGDPDVAHADAQERLSNRTVRAAGAKFLVSDRSLDRCAGHEQPEKIFRPAIDELVENESLEIGLSDGRGSAELKTHRGAPAPGQDIDAACAARDGAFALNFAAKNGFGRGLCRDRAGVDPQEAENEKG